MNATELKSEAAMFLLLLLANKTDGFQYYKYYLG